IVSKHVRDYRILSGARRRFTLSEWWRVLLESLEEEACSALVSMCDNGEQRQHNCGWSARDVQKVITVLSLVRVCAVKSTTDGGQVIRQSTNPNTGAHTIGRE